MDETRRHGNVIKLEEIMPEVAKRIAEDVARGEQGFKEAGIKPE